MKPIKAYIVRGLPHGARITACDNSGAKTLKVLSVRCHKTVKGRATAAAIGDYIVAAVVEGKPDIRKQVVPAVIVRQKKAYRRPDGTHIMFEDNAAIVLKDELGNPKGTMVKGPVAKEACERWPAISKIASIIV